MKSSRPRFAAIQSRVWPSFVFPLLFWLHAVMFHPHLLQAQTATPGPTPRIIHGVVKSGNMPIPGAGVSAASAAAKEPVNAWTDVDGSYTLRIPADGHYTVKVQMAAFAGSAQEVVLDATHQNV